MAYSASSFMFFGVEIDVKSWDEILNFTDPKTGNPDYNTYKCIPESSEQVEIYTVGDIALGAWPVKIFLGLRSTYSQIQTGRSPELTGYHWKLDHVYEPDKFDEEEETLRFYAEQFHLELIDSAHWIIGTMAG